MSGTLSGAEPGTDPGTGPDAGVGQPLLATDPSTIGGYEVLARLGAGGMGTVYLARDRAGTRVAVKVVHARLAADPQFLARFAAEAAAARRVAGFCTARVIEAGTSGATPFLVTEFVDGPTVQQVLERQGRLTASQVEALGVGVAAALTAIHAAGLVHRDLKPGNVLLSGFGPKVIDFGVAKAMDVASSLTATGLVFGTPGWIAPEQLRGSTTPAGDVFVWALLMVHAGTGWRAAAMDDRPGPADVAALPAALIGPVTAALEPDPVRRPTARDLLLRLCGSADPGPVRTATAVLSRHWSPTPNPSPARPPQSPPRAAGQRPATRPYTQHHAPSRPSPGTASPAPPRTAGHPAPGVPTPGVPTPGVPAPGVPAPGVPRTAAPGPRPTRGQVPYGAPGRPQYGPPRAPGQPPTMGQYPPPMPKRRKWWRRKRVVLPVGVLVVALLSNAGDAPDTSPTLPPLTARDGILEFTVTEVRCGQDTLGPPAVERSAQGQLCTIELHVRNFGKDSRRVHVGSQTLFDADGRAFDADGGAWVYLPESAPFFQREINPGNDLTATLVYDIATDSEPATLEVHDSPFSGGATITL